MSNVQLGIVQKRSHDFQVLEIIAWDFCDGHLVEAEDACVRAAQENRGVRCNHELRPTRGRSDHES
jgi:hypothetical protein